MKANLSFSVKKFAVPNSVSKGKCDFKVQVQSTRKKNMQRGKVHAGSLRTNCNFLHTVKRLELALKKAGTRWIIYRSFKVHSWAFLLFPCWVRHPTHLYFKEPTKKC